MKTLLVSLPLLLTACGLTSAQWSIIGENTLLREFPIIYGEIQSVKTAAKNPTTSVLP